MLEKKLTSVKFIYLKVLNLVSTQFRDHPMLCFQSSQAAAAALVFPGPAVGGAHRMLWHSSPPLLKPGDHHPPLHGIFI